MYIYVLYSCPVADLIIFQVKWPKKTSVVAKWLLLFLKSRFECRNNDISRFLGSKGSVVAERLLSLKGKK